MKKYTFTKDVEFCTTFFDIWQATVQDTVEAIKEDPENFGFVEVPKDDDEIESVAHSIADDLIHEDISALWSQISEMMQEAERRAHNVVWVISRPHREGVTYGYSYSSFDELLDKEYYVWPIRQIDDQEEICVTYKPVEPYFRVSVGMFEAEMIADGTQEYADLVREAHDRMDDRDVVALARDLSADIDNTWSDKIRGNYTLLDEDEMDLDDARDFVKTALDDWAIPNNMVSLEGDGESLEIVDVAERIKPPPRSVIKAFLKLNQETE